MTRIRAARFFGFSASLAVLNEHSKSTNSADRNFIAITLPLEECVSAEVAKALYTPSIRGLGDVGLEGVDVSAKD